MHENERMNQLECDPVVNGQRTEADVDGTWKHGKVMLFA